MSQLNELRVQVDEAPLDGAPAEEASQFEEAELVALF